MNQTSSASGANWPVHEAKVRLSELIDRAETQGPQTITRHGTERAVVLSVAEYHHLLSFKPNFRSHLLGGPKVDTFPVPRSRDRGRHVGI